MNTDIMYGDAPLYAYVYIGIRRRIAFPLFRRRQRIQGYLGDTFRIECYSEEEVSWYIQMCARLGHWLVLLEVVYLKHLRDGYIDSIDGGGNLEFTPDNTDVLEWIDGKIFGETEIREVYIDKEF